MKKDIRYLNNFIMHSSNVRWLLKKKVDQKNLSESNIAQVEIFEHLLSYLSKYLRKRKADQDRSAG